jgi:hypothetical protein
MSVDELTPSTVDESGIDEMSTYSPVNEVAVDEMDCQ